MCPGVQVVLTVAREAIRRGPHDPVTRMAVAAVQSGVAAHQREAIVLELRRSPVGWVVTLLAVADPAVHWMRGAGDSCFVLMAVVAFGLRPTEVTDGGPDVTRFTIRQSVSAGERESRSVVLGDATEGTPGILVVALSAVEPETTLVRIDMTTAATTRHVLLHRSPVIVAP